MPTMPNNVDIDSLAEKYDGISGSDIANAVLMAAFKAARLKSRIVFKEYVCEAVEGILASKNANNGVTIERRIVSEDYVKKQAAKHGKELKT